MSLLPVNKPAHLQHNAPLRWLARHLHKGKPLEELVRKQTYRRKRVAKVEVVP